MSTFYDPGICRYLSPDSLIQNHIDLNSYEYSSNFNNQTISRGLCGFFFKRAYRFIGRTVKSRVNKVITLVKTLVNSPHTVAAVFVSMAVTGFIPACIHPMLKGAAGGFVGGLTSNGMRGAFSGVVFAGLSGHFGSTWNVERVAIIAVAGGVLSKVTGGKFMGGFEHYLITSSARYLYNKHLGIDARYDPLDKSHYKMPGDKPFPGNNVGLEAGIDVPLSDRSWFLEGSLISHMLNAIHSAIYQFRCRNSI